MADTDTSSNDSNKPKPGSAPEIDDRALAAAEQQEIEQALASESDSDDNGQTVVDDKPVETKRSKGSGNRWVRFWRGYWARKKWTLILTVLIIAGAVLAVPASRYPLLAHWITRDVAIVVIDDGTKQPVASAIVNLDGKRSITDNHGKVTFKVRVGQRSATVSKKYYSETDANIFVAIKRSNDTTHINIKATGRQVPLTAINRISGKPIENVLIKASGTEVKTDKDGKAILVLPAGQTKLPVSLSADGFGELKSNLLVTQTVVPENSFQLTPSGSVYFLSKRSGNIDVVKTDLDGANRQTIVAGTGREEDRGTILLASRDWKYLAMLSRRDSDKPKLYLIDTAANKMTTMDEGDATFEMIGWSDSTFVYKVNRNATKAWEVGSQVVKGFNATNAKITVIVQTQAEGDQNSYVYQNIANVYLLDDRAVYTTQWSANGYGSSLAGKNNTINSVTVTGQSKKDLKSFPADKYYAINARLYKPQEIYFSVYNGSLNKQEFYEYESGSVKPSEIDENDFYTKAYPTYLASPSGKKVFWSEQRDGRSTFFTGNANAQDLKQVAVLDEHQVYGWYSDDYLLVSKKGSELFIMPPDGSKVTKITDYHKPDVSFNGYGGGYGGL
jgi:hypothetical protein